MNIQKIDGRTCKTCKFSKPARIATGIPNSVFCCRYPPVSIPLVVNGQITFHCNWAVLQDTEICGEWVTKIELVN